MFFINLFTLCTIEASDEKHFIKSRYLLCCIYFIYSYVIFKIFMQLSYLFSVWKAVIIIQNCSFFLKIMILKEINPTHLFILFKFIFIFSLRNVVIIISHLIINYKKIPSLRLLIIIIHFLFFRIIIPM